MDLTAQWIKEMNWPKTKPVGTAGEFYKKADSYYQWIPNRPWNVPKPGDMIVFDVAGYIEHVAIVVSANVWKVTVLEQNMPLYSRCHLSTYNYLKPRCIGWLHKR